MFDKVNSVLEFYLWMKFLQIFRRKITILDGILKPWRIRNQKEIKHEVINIKLRHYFVIDGSSWCS